MIFALDPARACVIMATSASPASRRAIQAGSLRRGLAPTASARAGSHFRTWAGSSSTTLNTPSASSSIAATVADAASSIWSKRPPASAVADQRHGPALQLANHVRLEQSGVRAIKSPVTQRCSLEIAKIRHRGLHVPDRGEGLPLAAARHRVERIVLALHRASDASVGPAAEGLPKGKRLCERQFPASSRCAPPSPPF